MAKKAFVDMTNGEKYVHCNKNRNVATAGKWASIITPFLVIFGVKFNEYFVLVEQQEKIKLTIGCIIAIIVAVVAIYQDFKHSEKTKHLAPVVGWGTAFLLSWLLKVILEDLTLILGTEFAGQCVAAGLGKYAEGQDKDAEEYKKLARADRTLGVKVKEKKEQVKEEVKSWF